MKPILKPILKPKPHQIKNKKYNTIIIIELWTFLTDTIHPCLTGDFHHFFVLYKQITRNNCLCAEDLQQKDFWRMTFNFLKHCHYCSDLNDNIILVYLLFCCHLLLTKGTKICSFFCSSDKVILKIILLNFKRSKHGLPLNTLLNQYSCDIFVVAISMKHSCISWY